MARVRQLLIGLASGSVLYSGMAPALGLGEITLHSALSQPLDAEIELLNIGDLSDSDLKVRLAPAEVFSRSGVDRLYFLNDLRFTPLLRGGRSVIRVVSAQPVREPYLNFIVEVARPSGQLYREYTLLLDPPGSSSYRTLAAAPVLPAAAPRLAPPAPRQASPAPVSTPRELPPAEQGQRYAVVSGDSLWKIAARLRAEGSTRSQQALMNDILTLNPNAFSNGDSNRLLAGAELLLPDAATTTAASVAAPVEVVESAAPAVALATASSEVPVEADAALLELEQSRVDQELASQLAETSQLQQSLAQLSLQVQQLQEQMSARDQQIAGLQAELAARQAADAAVAIPAVAAQPAPAMADGSRSWLAAGVALLALLLAGVAGLFWRTRARPQQPHTLVPQARVPVVAKAAAAPAVAPTPASTKPAVALSARDVPNAGPVWPAAGNDALQSANVYIAYGRFAEAAATLRKAIQAQPQRSDIGFRLLEVLAQLGDAEAFAEQEASLRAVGFSPVRIDELKARHPDLLKVAPVDLLDDAVLQLDETQEPALDEELDDGKLNLDDLSLDADWDLVSPFSPTAQSTVAGVAASKAAAGKPSTSDIFELSGSRDARSPFAESMLVEEAPHDDWLEEELDEAFVEQPKVASSALVGDLDHLATNRDNLAKLNMALAYIEQGSLDSACSILNEVINSGDEKQKQRARQLLAKIA
ncbi:FimV/HubP family polar landmark protein [Pseudomonas sp.]|uniref:FimV/HubP family polar landmark protein n=1 Tax=Pseudomonas sp. TaxID=306 RepID=UPI002C0645FC|nr:FimV/HubP family polar landmark protein [Pseudomonas sp.]HUE91224.1 FimV/HubP family polar landmark protein [Pseudomonas sp.]